MPSMRLDRDELSVEVVPANIPSAVAEAVCLANAPPRYRGSGIRYNPIGNFVRASLRIIAAQRRPKGTYMSRSYGFSHCGVSTHHMDETIHFYENVLGF